MRRTWTKSPEQTLETLKEWIEKRDVVPRAEPWKALKKKKDEASEEEIIEATMATAARFRRAFLKDQAFADRVSQEVPLLVQSWEKASKGTLGRARRRSFGGFEGMGRREVPPQLEPWKTRSKKKADATENEKKESQMAVAACRLRKILSDRAAREGKPTCGEDEGTVANACVALGKDIWGRNKK